MDYLFLLDQTETDMQKIPNPVDKKQQKTEASIEMKANKEMMMASTLAFFGAHL